MDLCLAYENQIASDTLCSVDPAIMSSVHSIKYMHYVSDRLTLCALYSSGYTGVSLLISAHPNISVEIKEING